MEKILVVEDNPDVNRLLVETLLSEGYLVDSAMDGIRGLQMFQKGSYDLVLLDIMLPYKSGDEVLKEIRGASDVPVMILSAKDMVGTKIDLLKLGADDYITKPFDLGEVVARVYAQLRRTQRQQRQEAILVYKDLIFDTQCKRIEVNGQELDLTAKECQIVEMLLLNRGKVFSKINLYESIWGEDYLGDDNAVKTHMSNLRTKLKKANGQEEYIETVWGLGYRLARE